MNLVQLLLSGMQAEHKLNESSSLETEESKETTNHDEVSPVPSEDTKETDGHDEPPVESKESRQSGDADKLTQSRGSSNDGYYTADEKEGESLETTKPEACSQVEEENDIATTGDNTQKPDCKESSQTTSKKPYQHLLAAWFGKPEQDAGHEKSTSSKSSNKPVSFFTTPLPANAPMLGSEAGPTRQRSPMKVGTYIAYRCMYIRTYLHMCILKILLYTHTCMYVCVCVMVCTYEAIECPFNECIHAGI